MENIVELYRETNPQTPTWVALGFTKDLDEIDTQNMCIIYDELYDDLKNEDKTYSDYFMELRFCLEKKNVINYEDEVLIFAIARKVYEETKCSYSDFKQGISEFKVEDMPEIYWTSEDEDIDWCAECCSISASEIIKKIQNKG